MSHTNLIQSFCHTVNDGLAHGKDLSHIVFQELQQGANKDDDRSLLENMYQNFCAAIEPSSFFDATIRMPYEHFEQGYELLTLTFNEDERDSRERLISMLEMARDKHHGAPIVLIGRFWRILGPHIYDHAGQLHQFYYDPLTLSENIAGIISGNYMVMQSMLTKKAGTSIGAIGNLAIREHFRGGKGHGTSLTTAFEKEMEVIATSRGEELRLIALEAQKDSVRFWLKKGYRCAEGTHYAQPPLDFDPVTGERFYDEVPEILMVKVPGKPDVSHVDAQLLADSVYTMYQNWCLAKTSNYPPAARKRAADYVLGKVFTDFLASLPKEGGTVRLTETID